MATCKDCLYYDVCPLGLAIKGKTVTCLKFKNKADFVETEKLLEEIKNLKADKEALINGQETLQKYIAKQKAEIERLQKAGEEAVNCFIRMESLYKIKCKELEVVKSTAQKEFAERLKDIISPGYDGYNKAIDNLVKELTEQ